MPLRVDFASPVVRWSAEATTARRIRPGWSTSSWEVVRPPRLNPNTSVCSNAKLVEEADHVVGEMRKGHTPIDIRGKAVALELDGNDATVLGQGGDDRS